MTAASIAWYPALLAALFVYAPWAPSGPVVCIFRLLYGMPCAGCGMTRALCLLLHGQVREAIHQHPLSPAILLYLGFLWVYLWLGRVRGTPPRVPVGWIGGTVCVVLLLFWAVRLGLFFADGGLGIALSENVVARLLRWLLSLSP